MSRLIGMLTYLRMIELWMDSLDFILQRFFLLHSHALEPKWWKMGAKMRAAEKKESGSEMLSSDGWGAGWGGVQVDCGFLGWRCWEDGRAVNNDEEVKRKNLRSLVWRTWRFWGWVEAYQGERPRAQREIQAWSSRERLRELKCSN